MTRPNRETSEASPAFLLSPLAFSSLPRCYNPRQEHTVYASSTNRSRSPRSSRAQPSPSAPRPVFEEIYRETEGLVRHIVLSWYGIHGPDADDLVQEVFLNYFRHQAGVANPRSWLVAAACNIGKKYYRDHRETPQTDEFLVSLLEHDSQDLADRVSRAVDAENTLAQLPEKCRTALRAMYNEGRTYREMSKIWHTSEDALKSLVYRCVRKAVEVFTGKGRSHDAS
jgi:RNA polymerase sigma factor (sigma-70 family)